MEQAIEEQATNPTNVPAIEAGAQPKAEAPAATPAPETPAQ